MEIRQESMVYLAANRSRAPYEDGALIDAHGATSDLLYTLGPACKGSLREIIAVPEIRVQVAELSSLLLPSGEEEDLDGLRSAAIAGSPSVIRQV